MANMLDLTVLQQQTLEIKMLDGSVIKLKKPSQKLMLEFVSFEKIVNDLDMEKQMEEIKALTLAILNNNTAGKHFSELNQDYDLTIQQAIITAYGKFMSEVMSQKN